MSKFNVRDIRTVGFGFAVTMLALGALPWVTITAPFIGSVSANAWSTNGIIAMLALPVVLVPAWFRRRVLTGVAVLVWMFTNLCVLGYTINDVTEGSEGMVAPGLGSGFILSGLVTVAVAAWLLYFERVTAKAKAFETVVSG